MAEKTEKVLIAVRLPVSLVERMRREADRRGIKLQAFVAQSLKFYMLRLKILDRKTKGE